MNPTTIKNGFSKTGNIPRLNIDATRYTPIAIQIFPNIFIKRNNPLRILKIE